MQSLGVLKMLGIKVGKGARDEVLSEWQSEIVLLPLQTGTKTDGEAIARLQNWLVELSEVFDPKLFVFEGLSEAVVNAIDHAYSSHSMTPKYPFAGHRWWATSCFDPVNGSLRFFVYDQGIGIPATLAEKADWAERVETMLTKLGLSHGDANLIEGAVEVGKTRTGLSERGKGLNQMLDVVRKAGGGHMRILSGSGDLSLDGHGTIAKRTHSSHIGGTLIEWSIPYDVLVKA